MTRSRYTSRARRLAIALAVMAAAALLPASAFAHFEGSLTKTVDRASASPGDVLTYTLTVTSQISIPTHPAGTVSDALPAGLTFVSASAGCTNAGPVVTCTFIPPAPGASISFTILARINADVAPGLLCNTATMSHPSDTTPADNTSTACTTIPPPVVVAPPLPPVADVTPPPLPPAAGTTPPVVDSKTRLTIIKTVTPERAEAGSHVVYTIVVKNVGAATAQDVQVCDALPAGVTVPNIAGGRLRNGQICWTVAKLAAGKTNTYRLTAVIDRGRVGTVVNSVCAQGGNTAKVCSKVPVTVTHAAAAPPRSGVSGVTG